MTYGIVADGVWEDCKMIRMSVQWFATAMEQGLRANGHKSGWSKSSYRWLLRRLREETAELERAINEFAKPDRILSEAADVASFAMTIADKAHAADEDGGEKTNAPRD